MAYGGSALTNGTALSAGDVALARGGRVLFAYADELEGAQQKVRRAIEHVEEAKGRIDGAETALAEAGAQRTRAAQRAGAAELEIAIGGLTGAPPAGAMDERQRARDDERAAADRQASARRELEHAQEDRIAAHKQGLAGMERAAEAAKVAAGALQALSHSPAAARAGQLQAAARARAKAEAQGSGGNVGDFLAGTFRGTTGIDLGGDKDSKAYKGGDIASYVPWNPASAVKSAVRGTIKLGTKKAAKEGGETAAKRHADDLARRGGAGSVPYAAVPPSKTPDWLRRNDRYRGAPCPPAR